MTLAAHRKALDLTQTEIADRLLGLGHPVRLNPATIARYESGERPIPARLLPLVAAAYGVSHTDIETSRGGAEDELAEAVGA